MSPADDLDAKGWIVWVVPVLVAMGANAGCGPGDDARRAMLPDATPDAAIGPEASSSDAALDAAQEEAGEEAGVIEDGSPPMCPVQQTSATPARAARSAGFSGTETGYYALFGASCQTANDCLPACASAGGTAGSCASGSQCTGGVAADGGTGCLPPAYWLSTDGALSESGMTANAAQVVLVTSPYDDYLVLTNFGVSVPDGATITGIQFAVRHATLDGNATDASVRILRAGALLGSEHAQSAPWPTALTYVTYGGAYDTWGMSWSPADVRLSAFGVSIASKYAGPSSGNEHAYIDSVRVTVFYTMPCGG